MRYDGPVSLLIYVIVFVILVVLLLKVLAHV
jgi:hypothetical protein